MTFENIYKRHHSKIYRHVYWITLSREDAEHIAQDTFLEFFEHFPAQRYDETAHVERWLHRKARHRALDWRLRFRNYLNKLFHLKQTESENTTPNTSIEWREIFAAMSTEDREILLLSGQGYKSPEIAQMLHKTPENVRQHLRRAKQRLRALQEQEG